MKQNDFGISHKAVPVVLISLGYGTDKTYNNQEKHKKPKDILKKPKTKPNTGFLSTHTSKFEILTILRNCILQKSPTHPFI